MKKIRTVMAYYNGEKFIDEQMQSIVDQIIPDGYEHEIYIYDDGSKKESLEYLKQNWGKSARIISKENEGPLVTFSKGFIDSVADGIDVVFFADQDDIYELNKYDLHIKEHEKGFSYVNSMSDYWFYKENKIKPGQKYFQYGHRISVSPKAIKFKLDEFKNQVERINKTLWKHKYHDTLFSYVFASLCGVAYIDEVLTKYRQNDESVTSSKNVSSEIRKVWRDTYGYYFEVIKPFSEKALYTKITISKFNQGLYYFDSNYNKRNYLAWMRKYWNNFWMYLRCRKMRNL